MLFQNIKQFLVPLLIMLGHADVAASQASEIEAVSAGIGYKLSQDNMRVVEPLPAWDSAGAAINVPDLGACSTESVEGVKIENELIDASTSEELMFRILLVSVWGGHEANIVCGGISVPVRLVPEVRTQQGKYVYNGTDKETLNQFLSIWLKFKFRDKDGWSFQELPTGGFSVQRNGRIILGLGFNDTGLTTVVSAESEGDIEALEALVVRSGQSSKRLGIDLGDGRSWLQVRHGQPEPETLVDAIDTAYDNGMQLNVAALDISIARGIDGLREKYGANWAEILYQEHLSD